MVTIAIYVGCIGSMLASLAAIHQGVIQWWLGVIAALVACLVVMVMLARALVRRRRARSTRAWSLLEAVTPEASHAASDLDAALAEQFEIVLQTSRASRFARRRRDMRPWYLVMGGPGAGKSSMLQEAGIAARLCGEGSDALRRAERCGVEFWISRDAVFLDCAGAYLVDPAVNDGWKALLAALSRARPSCPLAGVVIVTSVAELLAEESAVDALAACIRRRLDELTTTLDVSLPVHLMLTKADLQAGFCASFEGVPELEREQVLGFSLPLGTSCSDERTLSTHAQRLVQVIERRAIAQVGSLSTVAARHAAFAYPEQLEVLMARVVRLIQRALGAAIHLDPLLRGVYLTSARQGDDPIDGRASARERRTNAPAVRHQPYFLTGLLGKLIVQKRDRAGISARTVRRREASLRLATAFLAVACVLSSAGMVRAFYHNRALLWSARRDLDAAVALPAMATNGENLRALEPIRARLAQLIAWEAGHGPMDHRFGLYQGDLVSTALRRFYLDALRARFIAGLGAGLERALMHFPAHRPEQRQKPSAADYVRLYEQVRAYALLTYPKERGEPQVDEARIGALRHTLLAESSARALAPHEHRLAARHLDTYLALLAEDTRAGLARGPTVLAEARLSLRQVSIAKLSIDRIVAQLDDARLEQTLTSLLGATGGPLEARAQVHGAFTQKAWEEHIRPVIDDPHSGPFEPWVLGVDAPSEPTPCALRAEYFARYVDAWRGFISGLRIRPPRDHLDALLLLQDLTRGQPAPIERLMRAIARETELAPKDEHASSEGAKTPGIFDELRGRFERGAHAARAVCGEESAALGVRRALQGFLAFGIGDGAAPPSGQLTAAQIYQEQLVYVRDALQAYLDDETTADALQARLSTARTRVRGLIETEEIGWRPRFEALLWPAIDGASTRAMAALRSAQSSAFCTTVTLPFERALSGRYPFDRGGQDAALADVADFYRPKEGVVWGYYQDALKRDVPQVGGQFASRGDHAGRYAPALTRFLERSARLTTVLFPPRAVEPQVGFELRVRPAPGIAQVTLLLDGQSVDFHNGPDRWHSLVWPGTSPRRGASMRVLGQGLDEHIVQEGEWGLFRLLERGTVSFDPRARFFTVRFRLHTLHDVIIDVRPLRVDNPFLGAHGFLDAFRAADVAAPRVIVRGDKRRCSPLPERRGRR
jgi:type VI secretion system protein ImpL